MTGDYDNNNFDTRVDRSVLDFLKRDFRILPHFKAKPLQLSNFTEFYKKNKLLVECEEYARSVLDCKQGTSIRTMIRILSKFSGAEISVQRQVIHNLVSNDRYVRSQLAFKLKPDKEGEFELDVDSSLLFLSEKFVLPNTKSLGSSCYN